MRLSGLWLWWVLLCVAAVTLLSLQGCGGGISSSADDERPLPTKIRHVIVVFQENRTPDNLFHDPVLMAAGADLASSGLNSQGETVPLTKIPLASAYDLAHSHEAFVQTYDGGKMDGSDLVTVFCSPGAKDCPPPNAPFRYVDPDQVQPYFDMAEQYVFADRMFQTNQGPSYPAHQFIISGTSAPTATSDLFAAENPGGGSAPWKFSGCDAPPEVQVELIDPQGNEGQTMTPCFEHPTLTDLLDTAKWDWRYYSQGEGSIWTGPNSIQHIRFGPDWQNVILDNKHILLDIQAQELSAVSWVIPPGNSSDHGNDNDGTGPDWVASIVNAIGNSKYWDNTAIIVTWDDWGGWYDHVAPPIINSYEYGLRVPMIFISAYAKPHYISHVQHDFGSILKFIETVFALPTVGYADVQADDLMDCVDFSQKIPFKTIQSNHNADYFLHDTSPQAPVDDD